MRRWPYSTAARETRVNRSLGSDELLVKIEKETAPADPVSMLKALKWMLLNEWVPNDYEGARLMMLKKEGKPPGDPTPYWLICLTNMFC